MVNVSEPSASTWTDSASGMATAASVSVPPTSLAVIGSAVAPTVTVNVSSTLVPTLLPSLVVATTVAVKLPE